MTDRADSLTLGDLQKAKKNAESNIVAALQKQARLRYAGYEGASLEWQAAAEIERHRADLASECERRDEIIATTTKLWKDAEAALAEAREVIKDNSCSCGIICKHGNLTPNYCPSHRAARWMEKHK